MLKQTWAYLVGLLASLVAIAPAAAAVPAGVETVFEGVATDFGTVAGYGWVLFLAIVGGMILFGIVKRVLHKAAG